MSDALITVGTTPIYTSALYDNDATVWPNDTMLLDEWIEVSQLWLNESGLTIDHRTDGRSSASFRSGSTRRELCGHYRALSEA